MVLLVELGASATVTGCRGDGWAGLEYFLCSPGCSMYSGCVLGTHCAPTLGGWTLKTHSPGLWALPWRSLRGGGQDDIRVLHPLLWGIGASRRGYL